MFKWNLRKIKIGRCLHTLTKFLHKEEASFTYRHSQHTRTYIGREFSLTTREVCAQIFPQNMEGAIRGKFTRQKGKFWARIAGGAGARMRRYSASRQCAKFQF